MQTETSVKAAQNSLSLFMQLLGDHNSSSSIMYSHISFWCNQMGSAFLRINSSTSIPSMVGGRLTRFCFPLIKMVIYSFRRRFFSAFSAAVSFLLRLAMINTALSRFLVEFADYEWFQILVIRQYLIPGAPF